MNILTDKIPESVTLDGKIYRINSDFRTALKIINFAEENSGIKLLMYALKNFYIDLPDNVQLAIDGMNMFYKRNKAQKGNGTQLFSFEKDAELIFSSFMSQYGINLSQDNIHWYVFLALLKGLCGENAFSKVLAVRNLDISDIKDEKQKAYYAELKQKYSLSAELTIDEGLRRVF